MCGITGFVDSTCDFSPEQIIKKMTGKLIHRGPDDEGIWIDNKGVVAFGHRRLAVLDLSPAGHQPMHSISDRYVLVFNGEIYNHQELRGILSGYSWNGHSDTETLLAGFESWGVEETLKKCIGMFAIALWDKKENNLYLSRDRLGEKPLYYGWLGSTFVFGSELSAIKEHPGFNAEIDRNSLAKLLRYNYIPAPFSIYQGINKLLAGTLLKIPFGSGLDEAKNAKKINYWTLKDTAINGQSNQTFKDDDEAAHLLENILIKSIGQQMLSDVPLGAFLSGGIDSSTIVALMQTQSTLPVKTFTIGFDINGYNEAEHAKSVARHLGTEHTELYVTSNQAMDVIPSLSGMYNEPFADSSQIPTYLVSKIARQNVTVALSGDGGDELFGGYNRHVWVNSIWNKIGWLPQNVRAAFGKAINGPSQNSWDRLGKFSETYFPKSLHVSRLGEKLDKLSDVMSVQRPEDMYWGLVSQWKDAEDVVLGAGKSSARFTDYAECESLKEIEHRMMYLDTMTYLPNDILTKVDRAAMANSLEIRVPFLDPRIVEFAWKLPLSMKIRGGEGKWLLRQVLYKYVPREIIERPKMGFAIPIDVWLRGPLRDWAEALLNETRLRNEGYFNPVVIREKWNEHLSGRRNWHSQLWSVLMFQSWCEAQ